MGCNRGERRCGSRSGDDISDARGGNARGDSPNFAGDEAAQAFQLAFAHRIVAQEFVGEAYRAQRQADRAANMPRLRDGEFAAAAAQIDHQRGRRVDSRARNQAEVNQACLFHAGDDLDLPSRSGADPLQKGLRVAGIA